MNSIFLAALAFAGYILAYRFYGRYLADKIFVLDDDASCPAHEMQDNVDYMPTKKEVLFGHHYTSIAGTGPIVGPAIGVIWGWVPAFIWVFFGAIFMGAVHDFGAMVISARHQGRSIGDCAGDVIKPRIKLMFLSVMFLLLLIVIAIFAMIIAVLFDMYPQAVIPIWMEIPIAMVLGWAIYKKKVNALAASLIALAALYVFVGIGVYIPVKLPAMFGLPPLTLWVIILLVYAYIASVLPVWRLLQPRDYINGHELYVILILLCLGTAFLQPVISAPAFNLHPEGAPPILPFLFITIACGAISGFHSLVGSGTTSKQLDCEGHALTIGFGGMLMEGALAVLVLIAVAGGIGDIDAWNQHYSSWTAASGLGAKLGAFVEGSANMLGSLGIPEKFSITIMGVFIASFAGTTLDTATRLQRYVVQELAESVKITPLQKLHPATMLAVLSAAALALAQGGGKGGLILWPLFGATNQLLAALGLMVISVYLIRRKKSPVYSLIPMVFMFIITVWAMVHNLTGFIEGGKWHLVVFSLAVLVLSIWMLIEAGTYFFKKDDETYCE
jgi:carbon starvation protein